MPMQKTRSGWRNVPDARDLAATTPVLVQYKLIEAGRGGPAVDTWQVIVSQTAYRADGTAYPEVIHIIENPRLDKLKRWMREYGFHKRSVPELDMSPLQQPLF